MSLLEVGILAGSVAFAAAAIYWILSRARPDFITRHGVRVWTGGRDVTPEMVERETELTVGLYAGPDYKGPEGLRVYIRDDKAWLRKGKMVRGYFVKGWRLIRVAYTPDMAPRPGVAMSDLGHEIRHDMDYNFHS